MPNILGLDPNKFKHVESDENTTTLQHPAGHQIKIAHNAVSPKIKTQLEALASASKKPNYGKVIQKAEGGPVPQNMPSNQMKLYADGGKLADKPEKVEGMSVQGGQVRWKNEFPDNKSAQKTYNDTAKDMAKDRASEERKVKPKMQGLAEGGDVVGTGEIGKAEPNEFAYEHQLPCLNPNCKSHGRPHPNCRCYGGGGESGRFAEGGKIPHYCAFGKPHKKGCKYYDEGGYVNRDASGPGGMSKKDAQGMSSGAQQPSSISEGVENIKNEVSSWFNAKGGKVQRYAKGTGDGGVQADASVDEGLPAFVAKGLVHAYNASSDNQPVGSGIMSQGQKLPPQSEPQPPSSLQASPQQIQDQSQPDTSQDQQSQSDQDNAPITKQTVSPQDDSYAAQFLPN